MVQIDMVHSRAVRGAHPGIADRIVIGQGVFEPLGNSNNVEFNPFLILRLRGRFSFAVEESVYGLPPRDQRRVCMAANKKAMLLASSNPDGVG